ncbi:MAG: histidinol dehydrogenase, partial [Alphaproteobacteria bacterium]|nr:histidinol dehydrogenase [Alphaproteobacteria bacterium]
MPRRLNAAEPGFEAEFTELLAAKRETAADVNETVAAILADVRDRGDDAVIDYTERFDRIALTPGTMRFTAEEIGAAT